MTKVDNSGQRRRDAKRARNGFPLLPVSEPEGIVTLETVNALRDELVVTCTDKAGAHIAGRTPHHG